MEIRFGKSICLRKADLLRIADIAEIAKNPQKTPGQPFSDTQRLKPEI